MGNIYFGFSSVVDSGGAEGLLFVDQELHLIEISSLTPRDVYQAEFEFPG